jgi:hypothetical protein
MERTSASIRKSARLTSSWSLLPAFAMAYSISTRSAAASADEFGLFEAVGGEDGDLLAVQFHDTGPSVRSHGQ